MRFPVGRLGDNRVVPDPLFDPRDPAARPPHDAHDVQFRVPSSLNAMLDGMAQAHREDLLDQWRELFAEIAEDTSRYLQRGGYVIAPESSGAIPARLAITAVMHSEIPGFQVARWHLHLYVAATAVSLLDDRVLPVDWEHVNHTATGATRGRNARQVWERTSELWGVRWDRPRPGALDEIVEPPWCDHIDTLDRGVCPGPKSWGTFETTIADAWDVQDAIRSEAFLASESAAGRGPRWAPMLSDEDLEDSAPQSSTG